MPNPCPPVPSGHPPCFTGGARPCPPDGIGGKAASRPGGSFLSTRLFLTIRSLFIVFFAILSGAVPGAAEVRPLDGPAVLDREDGHYLLTGDIDVEATAFVIRASGVTLDLGGHSVTVRCREGEDEAVHAVAVEGHHLERIRIVNGSLRQRGQCAGSSPVHFPSGVHGAQIAHLSIDYEAPDASAIRMHWGEHATIRHNVIDDRGTVVSNRHQGVAAIDAGRGEGMRIHDNVIRRTRHIGVRTAEGADIRGNEIHIDSVAVNATGIFAAGGVVAHNRVTGEGVHPIGIWPGSDIRVYGNYVRVANTRAGDEYGDTGAACLRMTWGNDAVEVTDNIFVLDAEGTEAQGVESWGRALWVGLPEPGQRALFARNLIVANSRGGDAKAAGIAVVCDNASPHLVFRDNTVISNWGTVLLADDYGHADGYARFIGNTFVRQGDSARFRTVRSDNPAYPSTAVFLGNRCLGEGSCTGADLQWEGDALKEIGFGRPVALVLTDGAGRPLADAPVEIADAQGIFTFEGRTDEKGEVNAHVIDYVLTNRAPVLAGIVAQEAELPVRRRAEAVLSVRMGEREVRRTLAADPDDPQRRVEMRIDVEE